jgi:hypothetical protein
VVHDEVVDHEVVHYEEVVHDEVVDHEVVQHEMVHHQVVDHEEVVDHEVGHHEGEGQLAWCLDATCRPHPSYNPTSRNTRCARCID